MESMKFYGIHLRSLIVNTRSIIIVISALHITIHKATLHAIILTVVKGMLCDLAHLGRAADNIGYNERVASPAIMNPSVMRAVFQ